MHTRVRPVVTRSAPLCIFTAARTPWIVTKQEAARAFKAGWVAG